MIDALAERAYFAVCLAFGRLLRSARYSTACTASQDGERQIRKHRAFYAPVLIWLSLPLVKIMDTGVRVIQRRAWEDRERQLYRTLYDRSILTEAGGVLVLPCLAGETLAAVLEDRALEETARKKALELAAVALAEFHRRGFTHADAMAENVLIDLDAGVARWFDFETVHDSRRPMAWRRADDVRALLATCLVRTGSGKIAETLQFILDVYEDEAVTHLVATNFTSVWRRPLAFHLAQAPLSFRRFREIARMLRQREGTC